MKTTFVCLLLCCALNNASSQPAAKELPRPKLIVGLVIDQMRWDFLYRYYNLYSKGGFRRLLEQGHSCENTFIPYVTTVTGAGHACIYTGTVPAFNGIVGNNWHERSTNKDMYCVADSTVTGVGTTHSAGRMSPKNIMGNTIGDELRFSTNFKSKVISVAMKDRGAIPAGGHSSNGTYWYDAAIGKWISSSYFMNTLPEWVLRFNENGFIENAMKKDWNTLLPIEKYIQSSADDKPYETKISGEASATFPHKVSQLPKIYEAFRYTPYSNTYTFEFAKSAILNENLGKNKVMDMLAIGISATDWIGHSFGPNSIEMQDVYLRLDRDIADFLSHLDSLYKKDYLLFLSADHGVAPAARFLWENKSPAGITAEGNLTKEINELINQKYKMPNVVIATKNQQLYLDMKLLRGPGKDAQQIIDDIIFHLKKKPYVQTVFELEKLQSTALHPQLRMMYMNGYNPLRSGDIQIVPKAGIFSGGLMGSSHGGWTPHDSHIPLIWFGWNIKNGKTYREVYMSDIAVTLAAMLHIQMPNAAVGKVIEEIFN